MNRVKIDIRDWLWIIKLFELETSAAVIAGETGISYPTVLKAVNTIRMSIVHSMKCASETKRDIREDEAITVFGLLPDDKGNTRIESLPYDSIFFSSKIGNGFLVITKKSIKCSSLMLRGQKIKMVDLGRNFPRYRVYCSCSGFWPYAKERLSKHHGVSSEKLPLYLMEMEFRWINRNEHIFDLLLERLCCFMPDHHVSH
jgi:hypothetical protein